MKKLILLIIIIAAFPICALSYTSDSNTKQTTPSPDSKVNFRLFQTNNRWTFLKLDTRSGVISHVQYATGEGIPMEYPLNSVPLASGESAKPGRFFLYPTENTYNFILWGTERSV